MTNTTVSAASLANGWTSYKFNKKQIIKLNIKAGKSKDHMIKGQGRKTRQLCQLTLKLSRPRGNMKIQSLLHTLSSPTIADRRAGRTMPKWELRPGPATSAKAPRACALKALNRHKFKWCTIENTFMTLKVEKEGRTKGEDGPIWAKYEATQPLSWHWNRQTEYPSVGNKTWIEGENNGDWEGWRGERRGIIYRWIYLKICLRPSRAVSEVLSSSKACNRVGTISSIACNPALYIKTF